MPTHTKNKVVIIGCGNVAWHIAKQLTSLQNFSVSVYNHQPNPELKRFSKELKCAVNTTLNAIERDADFYFICVGDKNISSVSKKIKCDRPAAVILHTAGSLSWDEIKTTHPNKGVFYPVQTFSKNDRVNWEEVPVILEDSNEQTKKAIGALAKRFSKHVLFLNYAQRLHLHLAAVLVNNFSNALFVSAADLLKNAGIKNGFNLLRPLIKQTAAKVQNLQPLEAQTGPAKRNDAVVLDKHLQLLSDEKQLKKLYKQLSKLISKQQTAYA